jgi:PAS domain S-box-containing protein
MTGKLLIVEDEPTVALDLQQEVEQFGCEVVGLAQSADEALMAVEENKPDLALMDLHIVGKLDGIQTARLLRDAYQVPVIFLTAYSDDTTVARAARESPYGYLTKPFRSHELKATLRVALHKAKIDAGQRLAQRKITTTVDAMHEALLMVSLSGEIQFMNSSAERLIGCTRERACGRHLGEVMDLRDTRNRPMPLPGRKRLPRPIEEFGLSLNLPGGASLLVDMSIVAIPDDAEVTKGYIVTLRRAEERVRAQAAEEAFNTLELFDQSPTAMVQLDSSGHVVRVNQAMLRESGVPADRLLGRSLSGLGKDPDPRIGDNLMHKLLEGTKSRGSGTVETMKRRILS